MKISALTHASRMWRNTLRWVSIAPNPATHVQPDALGLLALVQQILGSLSDAMHFWAAQLQPSIWCTAPTVGVSELGDVKQFVSRPHCYFSRFCGSGTNSESITIVTCLCC